MNPVIEVYKMFEQMQRPQKDMTMGEILLTAEEYPVRMHVYKMTRHHFTNQRRAQKIKRLAARMQNKIDSRQG